MLIGDVRLPADQKLLGRLSVDGSKTRRDNYVGGRYVHLAASIMHCPAISGFDHVP